MLQVLVAIPANPQMPAELSALGHKLAQRLPQYNPSCQVRVCWFDRPFKRPEGERSIFARPALARNALLAEHLTDATDYVLWLDADLVEYPKNLIEMLLACGHQAVTAPLVLIEGKSRFYDVAAFVEEGIPVYTAGPHFGNVAHEPPYFISKESVVPCRSVGAWYSIPSRGPARRLPLPRR
jgi:hypothetical protein